MARRLRLHCLLAYLLVLAIYPGAAARAELTQNQVNDAKAATAFLITASGSATAFCISETGLFITCNHAIEQPEEKTLALVLDPTRKEEKRYPATVLRRLKEDDLAIIKVDLDRKVPALKLGDASSLYETEQIYAFGYPFGKNLAQNEHSYPAISVNLGHVTALRYNHAVLDAIQLDAQLNPGNSGGPVLDSNAHVVGIVSGGVATTGINFAIPISRLAAALEGPFITVEVPKLTPVQRSQPADFKISADWLLPQAAEPAVSLEVHGAGPVRTVTAAKEGDGKYHARLVPFPPPASTPTIIARLPIKLDFGTDKLAGTAADVSLVINEKPSHLSELQTVQRTPPDQAFTAGGKPIGTLPELAALPIEVGGNPITLDARKAIRIEVAGPPAAEENPITFKATLTAADGKVYSSAEKSLDRQPATVVATPVLTGKVDLPDKREIPFPSPISDIVAAEDGRSLVLYLKDAKKLAIFDVLTLSIRGYISLEENPVVFAAGSKYLLLFNANANVIQRYSLSSLEKEKTANNPFGPIASLTMGRSSPRMALLVTASAAAFDSRVMAFNAETMASTATVDSNTEAQLRASQAVIRASADGHVFGSSRIGISPTGFSILTLQGDTFSFFYEHESPGVLVPSADGTQIFTSGGGIYTAKYVPILKASGNWVEGTTYLPAYHPSYFLGIPYQNGPGKKAAPPDVGIYLTGTPQPLVQMPPLPEMATPEHSRNAGDPITLDKRYYFYPQLNLLLTLPLTNDKFVARPINVRQILDGKGIDYLYAESIAPAANVGKPYRYQLEAASNSGGVHFTLQSGPAGLSVSPDGLLTWESPAQAGEETVIVKLKDSSGRETFSTFQIVVSE